MFWIFFFVSFAVYAGYGMILMYHWFSFAYDSLIALAAAILYSIAGVILFTLMAAAIVSL